MTPQFLQKVGTVNDSQTRMIMMKLDDENKEKSFGLIKLPKITSETYYREKCRAPTGKQQNPSVFKPFILLRDYNTFRAYENY